MSHNSPDINYEILHNAIENAKNKHLPIKFVKYDKHKHRKTKWISQGILKFIDKLYKKLKLTRPQSQEYMITKLT